MSERKRRWNQVVFYATLVSIGIVTVASLNSERKLVELLSSIQFDERDRRVALLRSGGDIEKRLDLALSELSNSTDDLKGLSDVARQHAAARIAKDVGLLVLVAILVVAMRRRFRFHSDARGRSGAVGSEPESESSNDR